MEDTDIVINVLRSGMNSNRYVITAHYNKEENIRGSGYAEFDFISTILGRNLQGEIKRGTRDAIEDLKRNYNKYVEEHDHIKSLTSQAQSYAEECVKYGTCETDTRFYQ